MRRRILIATVIAIGCLAAFAPAALAECMNYPLEAADRPQIAFAFTATVTGIEHEEAFEEGSELFYHWVTLETDRVYRGVVPDEVVAPGSDWQCGFFYIGALEEGERLYIASERLQVNPVDDLFGNVLVWRQDGGQWLFYEEALRDGGDLDFYAPAARQATEVGDINRFVSHAPLPDTAMPEARPPQSDPRAPVLELVFSIALAALWASLRLSDRRPPHPLP